MQTAIEYLRTGKIDAEPLISKKIQLDDIVKQGFEILVNEPESHLKILVVPQSNS